MPLPKACIVCGTISDQTRCPAHRVKAWRQKPSSTKRGYDADYNKARRILVAQVQIQGGFMCTWCGGWFPPEEFTADHDPPLAQSNERHTNLVPACPRCNYGRTANVNR